MTSNSSADNCTYAASIGQWSDVRESMVDMRSGYTIDVSWIGGKYVVTLYGDDIDDSTIDRELDTPGEVVSLVRDIVDVYSSEVRYVSSARPATAEILNYA